MSTSRRAAKIVQCLLCFDGCPTRLIGTTLGFGYLSIYERLLGEAARANVVFLRHRNFGPVQFVDCEA